MQAMQLLAKPFRDKGYRLAVHGSVPEQGKGNDLDLLAIPSELAVPPPEEMEQLMCNLLGAQPVPEDPRVDGLLRTWCRACTLQDGRLIDMEYLRPVAPNLESETVSSLAKEFWNNGYFIELHSYGPDYDKEHYLRIVAIPARSTVTPPEEMEKLMCKLLDAVPVAAEPGDDLVNIWRRACVFRDGRQIETQYRVGIITPEEVR